MIWNWLFLAIGGFLLGSLFRIGWWTTNYGPEVRRGGYTVVGAGVALVVGINTWLVFVRDPSVWSRASTLVGYLVIAAGLGLIVRERATGLTNRPDRGAGAPISARRAARSGRSATPRRPDDGPLDHEARSVDLGGHPQP